jgi:hypothetical protein
VSLRLLPAQLGVGVDVVRDGVELGVILGQRGLDRLARLRSAPLGDGLTSGRKGAALGVSNLTPAGNARPQSQHGVGGRLVVVVIVGWGMWMNQSVSPLLFIQHGGSRSSRSPASVNVNLGALTFI